MRLIDADVAQSIADKELFIDEAGVVQFVLSHTPTIEAEPVKHGSWGKPFKVDADNIGYKCSQCGEFGVPCWDYCPNCGCKMDLEG